MPNLDALRRAALTIVASDPRFADHTALHIENYILGTGYSSAPAPHSVTRDLLYVYSANLLNSGGRGADMHCFGAMISGALDGLIADNRIVGVNVVTLASRCLDYLHTTGSRLLRHGDDTRYRHQLAALVRGNKPQFPLQRHLTSVAGFINLLCSTYDGCAETYHASFNSAEARRDPALSIVRKFNEIRPLKGIGVATGLNFLKDSQVSRFAGGRACDLNGEPILWAVKPDMHVLRLMLLASGRFAKTGLAFDDLVVLKQNVAAKFYATLSPGADWLAAIKLGLNPNHRGNEGGLWNCVDDVHTWAARQGTAPLEVDRLLYLIGSGRYINGNKLSLNQEQRYRIFAGELDLN